MRVASPGEFSLEVEDSGGRTPSERVAEAAAEAGESAALARSILQVRSQHDLVGPKRDNLSD